MKIELKQHRFTRVVLLLLLGISFKSFSQANATVTGIVRNEAGAAIFGATITAVNEGESAF